MPKLRVLVSGASVAGPALAFWLVRAGCEVTVVERAKTLRTDGQGLDVRDTAREVVRRMGIFDRLRDKSSHEEGLEFIDSNNRCFASFGVDDTSGNGESMTCDIEILRGELAGILVDVTKDDASYIFGDMVESLEETEKEIIVTFANGTPTQAFDLVVAADGIGSKIRGMAFGDGSTYIRSLNSYVAYFSVPRDPTDSMFAKVHWISKGRYTAMRPDNVGRTRAFVGLTAYRESDQRLARLAQVCKEDIPAQKALVQELFQDGDWEMPRVLKGMQESDDFYMQHVAQVRLKSWSSGRVTVVGDAGYACSPFAGMGTSISFIGAYVLAGEISRNPDDIPAALQSYERILRPYLESIQKLPPGFPWIIMPQTAIGVKVFETVIWVIGILSKTWLPILLMKIWEYLPFGDEPFTLPEYKAFEQ